MIVKDLFCNNEAYTHDKWEYRDVSARFSRLYYVIDGEAYYEEAGRRRMLRKGHLYLTPTKTLHSLFENPDNKLLHTYVHIYTVPTVSHFTEVPVVEGTPLSDAVTLWRKYASTPDKDLLIGIVGLVLSCATRELGRECEVARRAKEYIDSSDSVNLDMGEVTRAVGYTREHVTRSFSSAYRMTPMQYISSRRMELARRTIEGGASVTETAEVLGYSSPYALSRAFKRYFGLSPETYMKTLK